MLLLKVIVILGICWAVRGDLLDLYVQHMDETMKTMLYRSKRHPMDPVSRIKRNIVIEPVLRIGNFKKQQLDIDENWMKQLKKKIFYKNDALDSPNRREENLDPNQHEIFSNMTQNSKYFKEGMAMPRNITEANSRWPVNVKSTPAMVNDEIDVPIDSIMEEEQEKILEYESPIVEKQMDVEELTIGSSDFETNVNPMENWKNFERGIENNAPFEIITEDDQINSKPFDDSSFKMTPKSWNRMPKKYIWSLDKLTKDTQETKNDIKNETTTNIRLKRDATRHEQLDDDGDVILERVRSKSDVNFTRHEQLDDDGDIILEWDPSDEKEVVFKVIARTLGYIGIGFNASINEVDLLFAWVDDHTGSANLLDSHSEMMKITPVIDASQDVHVLNGSQNETHTTLIFSRKWETCDTQDRPLTGDTIRVLWALHQTDPELNTAIWHGDVVKRGEKALRLRAAAPHSPPRETINIEHWDVKLSQFTVTDNKDTVYWCKIFKAPVSKKHHMIGYTPLVEKDNKDLVHHVILYECASTSPILGQHARIVGASCYTSEMPSAWASCLQPVLAWVRGSKGEWLPEHVGIPIAENLQDSYYMLEVRYNNPSMKKVIDSSGVRLYLTPKLRSQEAGILVAGVAVSPLHLVPPQQKEYATAGYCTPHCTNTMFPKDGINIVSVGLHSHLAGHRLSLKHIRQGKELPRIVQDNHFDFDYQQSHTLEKEVKVLPGDELVAECVYRTVNRTKPTLGGYAIYQEMCLAFIVHYPRASLAACYSMTPAEDLFKTYGVNSFKGMTMNYLENLFLTMENLFLTTRINSSALSSTNQQQLSSNRTRLTEEIDETLVEEVKSALRAMRDYTKKHENDSIFARLVIKEPQEFRGRTMIEHILALPWDEELLARSIERNIYHGRHMTFCRKRGDELAQPSETQTCLNYTALPEVNSTICKLTSSSSRIPHFNFVINLVTIVIMIVIS